MAWLHASWTEWKNMFSFEIGGPQRQARDRWSGRKLWRGTADVLSHAAGDGSAGDDDAGNIRLQISPGTPSSQDFVDAIQDGRRPCGDIHDAIANLEIVAKSTESTRT